MTERALNHLEEHLADHDACTRALSQVQAFLHRELSEEEADVVRAHLEACDACVENYDVEQTITALIKRCQPPASASSELRMRIVRMSMMLREAPDA